MLVLLTTMFQRTFTAGDLGLNAQNAKIIRWTIEPKNLATRNNPVCIVETDKGQAGIFPSEDFILLEYLREEGDIISPNSKLALGMTATNQKLDNIDSKQGQITLDAEASISILLSDSHIGCRRTLQINNEIIELKVPAGIRNGQRLRVRGKGNQQPATGRRGDLYIIVKVLGAGDTIETSKERNNTYRNSGAGRVEAIGGVQSNRNTTYRNKGAGAKESFETSSSNDAKRNTSYRNSGVGRREDLGNSIKKQEKHTKLTQDLGEQCIEMIFKVPNKNNFFYGRIDTWDQQKTVYRRNEIICEITYFAAPQPYTHTIRAEHDLQIIRWIARKSQNLAAGDKLFVYTGDLSTSSCSKQATNNRAIDPETQYKPHGFAYQTINDISCCTGRSRAEIINVCQQLGCAEPFTLVYADRIADRLTGCPSIKRAWESRQHSASSQQQSNNFASSANQIMEPIEGLDDFIAMVREGYAFQVRDVLERIVNVERERIENERLFWRLGAGAVTILSGGFIDGFGIDDPLSGMAISNVAGMAHQFASKEQVEFLKKLQSEWLVLDRSPMDIRRRLGEPQGRFIGISRANILDMYNIHQSGSRGFHMVELDHAGNIAKGFKDSQSLEVLQRSYDEEDIGIISSHFYPSTIIPLKLCRTITPEEAKKKDPYYNQLSKAGAPFRVVYSDDTEGIMYKIQIPHHSDY